MTDDAAAEVPDPDPAYVPGVCNIGDAEVAVRRRYGWTGLVVTVVFWAAALVFGLSPWILVLLLFPGFLMATGYLQARQRFCSGFGMHGLSNFTDAPGSTTRTDDPDNLAKDRAAARQIVLRSLAAGAAVAVIGVLSAFLL